MTPDRANCFPDPPNRVISPLAMPIHPPAQRVALPICVAILMGCTSAHPVPDAKPGPSTESAGVRPVPTPSSSGVSASGPVSGPAPAPNAAPDQIVQVVGDDVRACAVFGNGTLQCWGGFNFHGELGQGHKGEPNAPNWVKGIRGAKKVALALETTCAILDSGELHCWGENRFFEADPRPMFLTPVRVPNLSGVVDVAVSARHGCAVDKTGALYCWGMNDDGQLGLGAAEVGKTIKKPTIVPGIADVIGVVASDSITVAWTKNGDIYRWGTASDPKRDYADASPRKMAILSGVKRADVEMQQACALLAGGQVRCFSHETLQSFLAGKEHDFGPAMAELASAFTGKKLTAVPNRMVFPDGRGLSGVVDLAVFNNDASAVTDKGEVYSWGAGERGTVGRPDDTKGFFPPTLIQGFTNAVAIVGSFRHRCGLEKTGEVRCFGHRWYLGSDNRQDSTSAVLVKGLPKIVHIASNEDCTYALGEDHSLWSWGDNGGRACGWASDNSDSPLPARVAIVTTAP